MPSDLPPPLTGRPKPLTARVVVGVGVAASVIAAAVLLRTPEPSVPSDARPTKPAPTLLLHAMGGSTTRCPELEPSATWPAQLEARLAQSIAGIGVTSDGRDGRSTFGLLRALEREVPQPKPSYLLFLVGRDDLGRTEAEPETAASAAVAGPFDLAQIPTGAIDGPRIRAAMAEHTMKYAPGFEARLLRLVERTRAAGIEPVLVTQPALWGDAADPTSGLNLGVLIDDGEVVAQRWQELEIYNGSTRRVGAQSGVLVIDLARRMPKDSRYFRDWVHFTREGAAFVAETLAAELRPRLTGR